MRTRFLILIWLVVLGACGGSADQTQDQAPVERVKAFVSATEQRDVEQMLALLTPDARQNAGWQLRQAMSQVQAVEYRSPEYVLSSNDGQTAYVAMSGVLAASALDGRAVEEPISQLVELKKIDDQWFIASNGIQIPTSQ